MRILLLSDIHANLQALDACLQAAPTYDAVVNLGDVVGYGANPNEVIDRARALGSVFVRGNHDKACSGVSPMHDFNPIAAMAVLWTRTILTQENKAWLRHLPAGPAQLDTIEGASFVHGSPLDEDEYLLMPADALDQLNRLPASVTFFGHTHVQGGFTLENKRAVALRPAYQSSDTAEHYELHLHPNLPYLINPGSVGQPRDNDWRAAFALFDTAASTVTYYRVPYLLQEAQRRILDAGLPERLATRLALGR